MVSLNHKLGVFFCAEGIRRIDLVHVFFAGGVMMMMMRTTTAVMMVVVSGFGSVCMRNGSLL